MRRDPARLLACLLLVTACLARPGSAMGDKCTNVCTCKWKSGKRTVECRGRGQTNVPDDIDSETQVLDLSDNNIRQLHSKIFIKVRLTNLQRLYLRNCHLVDIDREALAGLTNLVELDLSHNRLAGIPSASLSKASSLRDLALGHNPLGKVQAYAFKDTPSLVKLDLSSAELSEVAATGFHGLEILESLKLSHNRLSMLEHGTLDPLNKLTSIELHENPWTCDCQLREMKAFLVKQNLPTLIAPICHRPEQLVNRSFAELELDDFACRPVMLIVSRYAEATIGENASIVCSVTAIPPARVKWIWNGKVYTNHSTVNSYQRILINEEGGFRKLSTLVLTNAQETDSSNFFCVAENPAGSVEANFTLHVSLRTAGMSTLGSGQIAGISAALVILILLILLTIMVLFMRLRRMPQKDVKSPAPGAGADSVPLDGCTGTGATHQDPANHPQSATSTVSRRKVDDVETTSFNDSAKPMPSPGQLMGYAHRPTASQLLMESHDYLVSRSVGYEDGGSAALTTRLQHSVIAGPCYSSQGSLMPIDNPDLIRDTGRGADEPESYGRLPDLDESKLLYSECLGWEAQGRELLSRPSVSAGGYASREQVAPSPQPLQPQLHHQQQQQQHQHQQHQQHHQQQETFPPGAKQIRVWQKGVPVLPPVSALKRVLGSTRSSPDEGYQEGTGTDV